MPRHGARLAGGAGPPPAPRGALLTPGGRVLECGESKRFDGLAQRAVALRRRRSGGRRLERVPMATMVDIARRAGVSVSTVSYVLSGKRPISAETRQRVLAVMEECAYQPSELGRALATRRSRTVSLLLPMSGRALTEMDFEFVTAAAAVAEEHGYGFSLTMDPSDEVDLLGLTRRGRTDGLILMEIRQHDRRVELLRSSEVPFALIGHCADNAGVSYVDLDFAQAMDAAVAHLADLGHRRVALLSFPPELAAAGYGPAVRSAEGFARAVAAHGLAGIRYDCPTTLAAGEALAAAWAADPERPTGVVALNLEPLGGIMLAAPAVGLPVPDALSVVAVASERAVRFLSPAPTLLEFPVVAMGRTGAELLVRKLEGGDGTPPEQVLLEGVLRVRRSTAPAPGT